MLLDRPLRAVVGLRTAKVLAAQLDLLGDCAEGRELIDGAPKLGAWLDRMLARPSFAATQPPEVLREAA